MSVEYMQFLEAELAKLQKKVQHNAEEKFSNENSLKKSIKPILTYFNNKLKAFFDLDRKRIHKYDDFYKTSELKPYSLKLKKNVNIKKIEICHVIANFRIGGSSQLVSDIIELTSDVYNHFVITRYQPVPPMYQNVEVFEFPNNNSTINFSSVFRKRKVDLIHVHFFSDVVTKHVDWDWYHSFFLSISSLNIPIIQNVNVPIQPYLSNKVNRYIYVSKYVENNFGFSTRSISQVIYPGSDFNLFTGESNLSSKVIGLVYRLDFDKLNDASIDPLILAAKKLPDYTFHIIGDGKLKHIFMNKVIEAGVSNQFHFFGYVSYNDLPSYFKQFCLFVAPIFRESFGSVVPFAMKLGIPVVGYNTGALREIVKNQSLLVKTGESELLSNLIVDVVSNFNLMQSISHFNKEISINEFSRERMVHLYRLLYDEFI
ncbi:MAG: glycosyltransferase family 4 protein [Chloroherpetonaceae bacterium]|nr:glycosyltransferase family 4 protein [Chloroherpetonaceae bacterium]